MMTEKINFLVCYKCKEYITLHPNSAMANQREELFRAYHSGHPIQICPYEELAALRELNYKEVKGGF